MGCGGSKDDVVAGNTVAAKSLHLSKSIPPNTPATESEAKPSLPPIDSAASETKEMVVAPENFISKDSPDRYFSSRKDEEAIAAVNVLNKEDDQLLADSASEVEDSSVVKKEVVIVRDGEAKLIAEEPKSQDEKTSAGGEDSKEKEAASFEGSGSAETVAEKKN